MCWGGGPLPWGVSPGLGDKKGSWAVPEERGGGGGGSACFAWGATGPRVLARSWLGSPLSQGCSWGHLCELCGDCPPPPPDPSCPQGAQFGQPELGGGGSSQWAYPVGRADRPPPQQGHHRGAMVWRRWGCLGSLLGIWGVRAVLVTPGGPGQTGKVLKSVGTCVWLDARRASRLRPAGGGKPWGTPKVMRDLLLLFSPRLLGTHIPSPGHAKAAGIWLPGPHVTVPAQDTPAPCPGRGWGFSARIQPGSWKNWPGAEQTAGVGAMFNLCPSPCCVAGHGDLGTSARPL